MLILLSYFLLKKFLMAKLVCSYLHPDSDIRRMQESGWINACAL